MPIDYEMVRSRLLDVVETRLGHPAKEEVGTAGQPVNVYWHKYPRVVPGLALAFESYVRTKRSFKLLLAIDHDVQVRPPDWAKWCQSERDHTHGGGKRFKAEPHWYLHAETAVQAEEMLRYVDQVLVQLMSRHQDSAPIPSVAQVADPDVEFEEDAEKERRDADAVEAAILSDSSVPLTERQTLVDARRGQGRFRRSIPIRTCHVTGLRDERLLIASHIKPWAKSDHRERLDGENGLLLAPHVDALFDRGFISFAEDGSLLVSKSLSAASLEALAIDQNNVKVLRLDGKRGEYMRFHREHQFERFLKSRSSSQDTTPIPAGLPR